jgi:hypothetical protein
MTTTDGGTWWFVDAKDDTLLVHRLPIGETGRTNAVCE